MSIHAFTSIANYNVGSLNRSRQSPLVAEPVRGSSPLATATAISALLLAEQHDISFSQLQAWNGESPPEYDAAYQLDLSELIVTSLHWLAHQQHDDGGWSDGEKSELATTMLVRAAFQLTGVPVQYTDLVERADSFVKSHGGATGLRTQHNADRLRVAPVFANCAMADSLAWKQVPAVPYERACLSPTWSSRLHVSTERFASPFLLAVGMAKFHHDPPRNPLSRMLRRWSNGRAIELLSRAQSRNGSFHNSIPETSFVVMSFASMGFAHVPVVRRGVEFLFEALRPDGSWPLAAISGS